MDEGFSFTGIEGQNLRDWLELLSCGSVYCEGFSKPKKRSHD